MCQSGGGGDIGVDASLAEIAVRVWSEEEDDEFPAGAADSEMLRFSFW